jgi:peptidoglycan hydrolase CwlO-like protein
MKQVISATVSIFLLVAILGVKNVKAQDSSQDVLRNLDNFNKSLSGWMRNLDKVNDRIDSIQKNINDSLAPITGMVGEIRATEARIMAAVERVAAIERTASVAEINATLATFTRNLELLKRLIAEMGKRVEDQEVKTTVLEKRYQEAQRPLEPIRKSIDDLTRSMAARLSEQERKMTAVEESIVGHVQSFTESFEERLKSVEELEKQVRRLEATGPVVAHKTAAAGPPEEAPKTPAPLAVTLRREERLPTPEDEGYEAIGDGFYVRNVELHHFGSSSRITGEMRNLSGDTRGITAFTIRIYNAADTVLFTQDFSVKSFEKDEIRKFSEIISGYSPIDIARYEIAPKGRY